MWIETEAEHPQTTVNLMAHSPSERRLHSCYEVTDFAHRSE